MGSPRAGAPGVWQPPPVEELQAMLPQYEVLEIVGRGGMGAVYQARQKSLRRLVAIKVLPPEVSDDALNFRERFQHEAETMAKLSHPGIVAVHDFGETSGGLLYFVMEFIDGTDVARRIESEGPLPVGEAVRITKALCEALDYAHSRGVIHRDIKPANVLIDGEGRIKVADFGLAKITGHSMQSGITRTNVAMGTQEFAAPEQLTPGAMVDHRADIYSLGVMLYQMLTGDVPRVMFKLPSRCRPELGTRFDALICKALETDPAERFQSTAEFRRELDAVATGSAAPANPSAALKQGSHLGRPKLISAAVVAMVVVGVGGWFILGHRHGHASLPAREKIKTNTPALSSSSLPRNEWIKLLDTPEAVARSGIKGLELKDGWLTVTPERLYLCRLAGGNGKVHDMAFRATVRPPMNGRPVAAVLHTGGDLEFFLDVHREWLTLRRVKHLVSSKREDTDLGKVPLDLAQAKDGALHLEVSIQGNLITIMGDGAKLMEVRDEVAAGIGDIALVAPSETEGGGKIKDIALKILGDGPNEVITENVPAPEARAIRLWDAPDKIPKEKAVRWENGAVVLGDETDKGMLNWAQPRSRDSILRAEVRVNPDAEYAQLRLRYNWTEGPGDFYRLQLYGGMLDLSVSEHGKGRAIKAWPLPRAYGPDDWARLELRAVGDALTVSLDGDVLETIRDSTLSAPGSVMIVANKNGWFRHVEYVPLDKPLSATAGARVIDLLSLVDVKRDAINSEWKVATEGGVRSQRARTAGRLEFPYAPPAEYDYEIEFTVEDGASGYVMQVLAVPDHWLDWRLLPPPAFGPALDGVEPGNGPRTEGIGVLNRLKPGDRHRSLVEVRRDSLRAFVDGSEIARYGGDLKRLSDPVGVFKLNNASHVGVGTLDVGMIVHKATVREIRSSPAGDGFRPLFDGKSLEGWLALDGSSPPGGWRVVDGAMTGKGYSAVLTREEFGDFDLTLDWRVNPQGNGGIFYRVAEDGMVDHPLHAVEFNLMDENIPAPPSKHCGAAFNVKPPSQSAARPAGEWNTARLLVQGTKVQQWINDKLVCSYDLADPSVLDGLETAQIGKGFVNVKKGRVALQDWTGEAFYRNVRIREFR
ncbi:MAG: DUF1080 domain-containing protein [Verrucomicrobiaceae bacterium]|nr:DUF1080 domain-containing protein [Verrucomicrobiaceae bacterium]